MPPSQFTATAPNTVSPSTNKNNQLSITDRARIRATAAQLNARPAGITCATYSRADSGVVRSSTIQGRCG